MESLAHARFLSAILLMSPFSRIQKRADGVTMGPCPLCGESPVTLHLRAKNAQIPREYRITEERLGSCWDLWRCKRCGLIFSDWRLTQEEIEKLYRGMEDALYEREDESRRRTFRNDLARIARRLPQGARAVSLLDIGCATGLFLLEAAQKGWSVAGVDVSPWAIGCARERGIQTLHEGTVFSLAALPSSFDVITLLDTIEHDQDPAALLDRVRALLKPQGLLYLTTPDIGGITARLFGSRWWGINPLHLTYFSRAPMKRLLERHGFSMLSIRSYRRTFTLGYWVHRLAHFHPGLSRALGSLLRFLHLPSLPLPLTLFDAMEVIARKRAGS